MATQTPDTTSTLSNLMSTFYDKKLLAILTPQLIYDKLTVEKVIPENAGKSVIWNRFTREAGTTTAFTEGTVPDSSQRTTTQVSTTVAGYGDYYVISDLLKRTATDDELAAMLKTCAHQAKDTIDLLIRNACTAGGTSFFANGNTALTGIGNDDVATMSDLRKIVRQLEGNDVPQFEDGFYHAIIHPHQKYDITNTTAVAEWHDISKYTDLGVKNIYRGELGSAYGVRIMMTSNVFKTTTGTSASATAYYAHVAGDEAVARVSVTEGGGTPKMFRHEPGKGGLSDPLGQLWTVGWTIPTFASKVLEATRIYNWITGATVV